MDWETDSTDGDTDDESVLGTDSAYDDSNIEAKASQDELKIQEPSANLQRAEREATKTQAAMPRGVDN